jgi:hypothetical protein
MKITTPLMIVRHPTATPREETIVERVVRRIAPATAPG